MGAKTNVSLPAQRSSSRADKKQIPFRGGWHDASVQRRRSGSRACLYLRGHCGKGPRANRSDSVGQTVSFLGIGRCREGGEAAASWDPSPLCPPEGAKTAREKQHRV